VSIAEAASPATLLAFRARMLAFALLGVFVLFGVRAMHLSVSGPPDRQAFKSGAPSAAVLRADIVDRNGVLLATTMPSWALAASPGAIWEPEEAARKIAGLFSDLDAATLARRLREGKGEIYLKRDLTAAQRDAVHNLGMAGLRLVEEPRRVYPNQELAGQVLGGVGRNLQGASGLERALDAEIRTAAREGRRVRLAIDTRIQHAAEQELAAAVARARAQSGAALVLDGRSGEVLAAASWPPLNPNSSVPSSDPSRVERVSQARHEMGSVLKPFTVAIALEERKLSLTETFVPGRTLEVPGYAIKDHEPFAEGPATIKEALAQSSNVVAGELALRVGAPTLKKYWTELGLTARSPIQIAESAAPVQPRDDGEATLATLGFGHGATMSLAALAGAYSVFVNDGALAPPTLLAREAGAKIRKRKVFSALTVQDVSLLMRDVVAEGTASRSDLHDLDIAGKTGTAELVKPGGGYDPNRVFSSFVAVFPARAPHYVIALSLDEPQRTPENGFLATGGAAAAPAVGLLAGRIAPFLGVAPAELASDQPRVGPTPGGAR
jgi:cell division protein FtsI (penicillin-binding protein 3)